MKGVSEYVVRLLPFVIFGILTVAIFYFLFPRTGCDEAAKLSSEEVKAAIECAAGNGPQGCKKTATVKLCQEDSWSMAGTGYLQSYYGLMSPQYLLYYQKFPKKPVSEVFPTGYGLYAVTASILPTITIFWSETYPFERAWFGQRNTDLRPTVTQFKEFYKTKYLENACTTDTAMCLNIRGNQETVKINSEISDVKIRRSGLNIPTGFVNFFSDENPKFYLASPCYATVSFNKDGNVVMADINKLSTDASNYCYADNWMLGGYAAALGAESGCNTAILIATLGTGKVAQAAGKEGAKEGAKIIGKELAKGEAEQIGRAAAKKVIESSTPEFAGKEAAQAGAKFIGKELTEKESADIGKAAAKKITEAAAGRASNADILKGTIRESIIQVGEKNGVTISKGIADKIAADIIKEKTKLATKEGILKATTKESIKEVGLKYGKIFTDKEAENIAKGIVKKASTPLYSVGVYGKALARQSFERTTGIPLSGKNLADRLGVPCADVDICRGLSACMEPLMWPGWPLSELTIDKMKGGRSINVATEVLTDCCRYFVAAGENNTDNFFCTDPGDTVDLLKPEMRLKPEENLNLTYLGKYVGFNKEATAQTCRNMESQFTKTCISTLEAKEKNYIGTCGTFVTHTYDFGRMQEAKVIETDAVLFEDECDANVKVEISNDKNSWQTINDAPAQRSPVHNYYVSKNNEGEWSFRYVKISDSSGRCNLDFSTVSIDPSQETTVEAVSGTPYELEPSAFIYFITPAGYSSTAKSLCASVKDCIGISKWVPEDNGFLRYTTTVKESQDFPLGEKQKVGVMAAKKSNVIFTAKTVSSP